MGSRKGGRQYILESAIEASQCRRTLYLGPWRFLARKCALDDQGEGCDQAVGLGNGWTGEWPSRSWTVRHLQHGSSRKEGMREGAYRSVSSRIAKSIHRCSV